MNLKYVVITSVDRDDLRDGGAAHFADCIKAIRSASPNIKVEVLTPDFRGRLDTAIALLSSQLPDVMNHNLETVPRLYKKARPGADYQHSLDLLHNFKKINPRVITKSGVMVGLGESDSEIEEVMRDLKRHEVDMVTIGQYLQPTKGHLPVHRYVHPDQFRRFEEIGLAIGFKHVASGPLVRSSYHADEQAGASLTENS